MTKYSNVGKLEQEEEQKLLLEFCYALVDIKKPEEAALFLRDLLSKQEIEMLAKRLQIARLLIQGKTFEEISKILKTSMATISRVSEWLKEAGEGYRLIVERITAHPSALKIRHSKADIDYDPLSSWSAFKRKYPLYFWPDFLLKDIIRSASNRHRKRLLETLKILKKSGKKSKLFSELEKILIKESKNKK